MKKALAVITFLAICITVLINLLWVTKGENSNFDLKEKLMIKGLLASEESETDDPSEQDVVCCS